MPKSQLHDKTLEYLKKTDLEHRKSKGQYFTPQNIIEKLLSKLPHCENPSILDPGCGTGEFLRAAQKKYSEAELMGWEIDKSLTKIAQNLLPKAKIEQTDTLKERSTRKFDFIIGNPPYYEFKPDKEIKERYEDIINGRVNIYSLFIYQSIELLKDGGYLAFVVPPSMNNGAYFSKLRRYIVNNCNIEYLTIKENTNIFDQAFQSVMLLVLKKGKNKSDYIFKENGILIFSEETDKLKREFSESTSLLESGFKVRTGRLTWNQNKETLTNNREEGVPLIWSHNITGRGLKLENKDKPQYVKTENYDIGPAIVVNRVVGKPGSAHIRAALIPKGMKFIGENHVNVIIPDRQKRITQSNSLGLNEILNQLNSPEKAEVIQGITGNTQISKNELEKLFPITVS